jgi:hypothetical protein
MTTVIANIIIDPEKIEDRFKQVGTNGSRVSLRSDDVPCSLKIQHESEANKLTAELKYSSSDDTIEKKLSELQAIVRLSKPSERIVTIQVDGTKQPDWPSVVTKLVSVIDELRSTMNIKWDETSVRNLNFGLIRALLLKHKQAV